VAADALGSPVLRQAAVARTAGRHLHTAADPAPARPDASTAARLAALSFPAPPAPGRPQPAPRRPATGPGRPQPAPGPLTALAWMKVVWLSSSA
jgi:hypothetical protein